MHEIIVEIKNIKETKIDLRKFGLSVGIVLIILSILLYWLDENSFLVFGIIGFILIILTFIYPKILKPLNKVWMALAIILGWFMTRVILIGFYYIILTPIGIIAKIFNKKFLNLKISKSTNSYWVYRKEGKIIKSDFENQF